MEEGKVGTGSCSFSYRMSWVLKDLHVIHREVNWQTLSLLGLGILRANEKEFPDSSESFEKILSRNSSYTRKLENDALDASPQNAEEDLGLPELPFRSGISLPDCSAELFRDITLDSDVAFVSRKEASSLLGESFVRKDFEAWLEVERKLRKEEGATTVPPVSHNERISRQVDRLPFSLTSQAQAYRLQPLPMNPYEKMAGSPPVLLPGCIVLEDLPEEVTSGWLGRGKLVVKDLLVADEGPSAVVPERVNPRWHHPGHKGRKVLDYSMTEMNAESMMDALKTTLLEREPSLMERYNQERVFKAVIMIPTALARLAGATEEADVYDYPLGKCRLVSPSAARKHARFVQGVVMGIRLDLILRVQMKDLLKYQALKLQRRAPVTEEFEQKMSTYGEQIILYDEVKVISGPPLSRPRKSSLFFQEIAQSYLPDAICQSEHWSVLAVISGQTDPPVSFQQPLRREFCERGHPLMRVKVEGEKLPFCLERTMFPFKKSVLTCPSFCQMLPDVEDELYLPLSPEPGSLLKFNFLSPPSPTGGGSGCSPSVGNFGSSRDEPIALIWNTTDEVTVEMSATMSKHSTFKFMLHESMWRKKLAVLEKYESLRITLSCVCRGVSMSTFGRLMASALDSGQEEDAISPDLLEAALNLFKKTFPAEEEIPDDPSNFWLEMQRPVQRALCVLSLLPLGQAVKGPILESRTWRSRAGSAPPSLRYQTIDVASTSAMSSEASGVRDSQAEGLSLPLEAPSLASLSEVTTPPVEGSSRSMEDRAASVVVELTEKGEVREGEVFPDPLENKRVKFEVKCLRTDFRNEVEAMVGLTEAMVEAYTKALFLTPFELITFEFKWTDKILISGAVGSDFVLFDEILLRGLEMGKHEMWPAHLLVDSYASILAVTLQKLNRVYPARNVFVRLASQEDLDFTDAYYKSLISTVFKFVGATVWSSQAEVSVVGGLEEDRKPLVSFQPGAEERVDVTQKMQTATVISKVWKEAPWREGVGKLIDIRIRNQGKELKTMELLRQQMSTPAMISKFPGLAEPRYRMRSVLEERWSRLREEGVVMNPRVIESLVKTSSPLLRVESDQDTMRTQGITSGPQAVISISDALVGLGEVARDLPGGRTIEFSLKWENSIEVEGMVSRDKLYFSNLFLNSRPDEWRKPQDEESAFHVSSLFAAQLGKMSHNGAFKLIQLPLIEGAEPTLDPLSETNVIQIHRLLRAVVWTESPTIYINTLGMPPSLPPNVEDPLPFSTPHEEVGFSGKDGILENVLLEGTSSRILHAWEHSKWVSPGFGRGVLVQIQNRGEVLPSLKFPSLFWPADKLRRTEGMKEVIRTVKEDLRAAAQERA